MTSARRLAVLAAGVWIGLVTPAVATPHQAEPDDGWVVENVSISAQGEALTIAGTITPPVDAHTVTDVEVSITRDAEPALAGCSVSNHTEHLADGDDGEDLPDGPPDPTTPTTELEEQPGTAAFAFTVPVRCNGQYSIRLVRAIADAPGESDVFDPEPAEPRPLGGGTVNAAPPDVAGVTSSYHAATRTVALVWQPPVGYGQANVCSATTASDHPDFAGYVVQRAVGDSAAFATLPNGTVAAGSVCLADQLPADAPLGQYRYRVLAARTGTAGPVVAAGAAASITTVAVGAAPANPAPPTTAAAIPRPATSPPANTGGPVVAPATPAPPAPDDGTFEETLDYPELGEEAAVIPDDADAFLDFVPSPGPGILVPFAIAECLAVWAFHLRYLARRADDGF